MNSYREIINKKDEKFEFDQNFIFKLPLMHQGLNQRLIALNEKCKLGVMSMADFGNIENLSLRDYFKIELLFKLFFFFILFGIHMKGYNIPIFITLLIIYYWYYLYMDINAFYDKKIGEIKLTKDEIREVKSDFKSEEQLKNEEENIDINYKNEHDNFTRNHNQSDINDDGNKNNLNNPNLLNENEIDYDLNYVKSNDIIIEDENGNNKISKINYINQEKTDNLDNLDSAKNKELFPEMEGISNLMKKYEKEKIKRSPNETQDGFIKYDIYSNSFIIIRYYLTFLFEIIFTLIMSLFPFWFDEFELHNPVILQQIESELSQTQNLISEEPINDIKNENHITTNENQINDRRAENKEESQILENEMNSLRPEIEMVSRKQKLPDYSKSIISEKILIKSSNDTRLVNNSEDHNNVNNLQPKYILVDENENRTENEFVFSENVNIDTLSYNEPILESLKKKNEKEQEETTLN